jgi:hypothetical protein
MYPIPRIQPVVHDETVEPGALRNDAHIKGDKKMQMKYPQAPSWLQI